VGRRTEQFWAEFQQLCRQARADRTAAPALTWRLDGAITLGPVPVPVVESWLAGAALPAPEFDEHFRVLVDMLQESAAGTGYAVSPLSEWTRRLRDARAETQREHAVTPAAGHPAPPLLRAVAHGRPLIHTGPLLWGVWCRTADGPRLALGTGDGAVLLWNPADRTLVTMLDQHSAPVVWGGWAGSGERGRLATRDSSGTAVLWDVDALTGRRLPGRWTEARWDRTGDRPLLRLSILTAASDRVWDPETGDWAEGGHDPLGAMWQQWRVWLLTRESLTTGGRSGGPGPWASAARATTGEALFAATWLNGRTEVRGTSGTESPYDGPSALWGSWITAGDETVLALGDADGRLWWWRDTVREFEPASFTSPGALLWGRSCVAGRHALFATGGADGAVRLWDPVSGEPVGEPVRCAAEGSWGAWGEVDGRPVLAVLEDAATVRLWEVVEDLPVARMPRYQADSTTVTDQLSRSRDAEAIAELITARTVSPPLAVGLFGDWGTGKSHFLNLLEQRVATQTPGAHTLPDVRQVRFNAWHYAETDLWASLVTEVFAQLAAPAGDGRAHEGQRSRSRLAAELLAARGLPERLSAARERLSDLEDALDARSARWDALEPGQRADLTALAGDRPKALYEEAALLAATGRASVRTLRRLVRGIRLRTVLLRAAGALLVATGLAVLVYWGLPRLVSGAGHGWRWAITGLSEVSGLAFGLEYVRRAVSSGRRWGRRGWREALRIAREQRTRIEAARDLARAEVAELERQLREATAAGQLAGMVAERAGSGGYRSRLGVMTQIREDFERMAKLLAKAAKEADERAEGTGTPAPEAPETAAGPAPAAARALGRLRVRRRERPPVSVRPGADLVDDELPRVRRVVLYIDDLDRCPARRVVEVLEAIHLLLAVDLFVVVVAVDPRWLLHAIGTRYRDMFGAGPAGAGEPADDEDRRLDPAQYLEKIFQVVLTLPPLDTDGYRKLLGTLVRPRADAEPDAARAAAGGAAPDGAPATDAPAAPAVDAPAVDAPGAGAPEDDTPDAGSGTAGDVLTVPEPRTEPAAETLPGGTPAPAPVPSATREAQETPRAAEVPEVTPPSQAAATPAPSGTAEPDTARPETPAHAAPVPAPGEPNGGGPAHPRLPAPRTVERVDPLSLEPGELALLDLLGPPFMVATPRAVTRLANSYGLLNVLRRDHREADLGECRATVRDAPGAPPREAAYRPYRAGMVLLGALIAHPAAGPALLAALRDRVSREPEATWAAFLDELEGAGGGPDVRAAGADPFGGAGFPDGPGGGDGATPLGTANGGVNGSVLDAVEEIVNVAAGETVRGAAARPGPYEAGETVRRDRAELEAVAQGLRHVTEAARARGLELPEPLAAWDEWVVPVGRLSFPTGRVVGSLERRSGAGVSRRSPRRG
jgi:hypothetical protein